MNSDKVLIPFACRFVASDQWLTAHFDSTWKISEVKQYILTKVYNRNVADNDHLSLRDRPVSPITFASTRTSFDGNFEGSIQDDHVMDLEPHLLLEPTRQMRIRQPPSQPVASPPDVPGSPTEHPPIVLPPHHYPMLAFSTGQLLEGDCTLAWYRLRPHELLELHPPGAIVRLQRDVMVEYVKPYLELDVRALRVIVNDKDTHPFGPSYAPDMSSPSKNKKPKDSAAGESHNPCVAAAAAAGSPASQSARKRRKTKLEWRDRYLVIRQGMLSLFKSRTDLTPVHTCPLANLTTLRGQEEVVHTTAAAMPSPHVICAKFRADVSTPSVPEPQSLSSPMAEQWNDPWSGATISRETDGFHWGRRESKEDIKQQRRGTADGLQQSKVNTIPKEDVIEGRTTDVKGESLRYGIDIGDGTQGTWLVLDTLDELAHSNLLRVLHRCSPDTISSTLVPEYLLPEPFLSSPSSHSSPLPSQLGSLRRFPCPYPEWRMEVSQRAQQSGLGNVSDSLSWVLIGGPPLEPSASKHSGMELRRKFSDLTTDELSTVHEPFSFDADDDGGDDGDYELEWDSWARDLTRQVLASSSNDIAVTVTEPASAHPSYPHRRIRPTTSSSTFSSVTMSELSRRPSDIMPGANMGLLSVDSPALLTAPSVLPFQSTGVTTSTVSAGGVVRTRSLIMVDGRRGRGVARAMDVVSEDGDDGPFPGKHRAASRQARGREENGRGAAMASSAPTHSSSMPAAPTANTITSTVTVRESVGTPSSPPLPLLQSPRGSPFAERCSPSAAAASTSASVLAAANGGASPDTASGITTMTTTTTIKLLPCRSSVAGDTLLPEASSPSRKRYDKAEKGKGKQSKNSSRGKVFRPERLVSKIDSALDFVTG